MAADRKSSAVVDAKKRLDTPLRATTAGKRIILGISFETFPNFFNNVYLIDDGSRVVLVDCGSGFGSSDENLTRGLESIGERYERSYSLDDVDTVLVTHGHTDHFGGVEFVRSQTDAPIGIHTLDQRVLSHYEERVVMAARGVSRFLEACGLSPQRRDTLLQMYSAPKSRFHSLPVDFSLEEGEPVLDASGHDLEIEVIHVPGHCPGQVCLRVDDVLLTADHVLARITPHQSPESITLHMGLGHYLESLGKIERLEDISLGLGGHEAPILDLAGRVREIRASHHDRLEEVLEIAREPQTVAEISRRLFGDVSGYTVLLALEEAGAHVEYLYQRGALVVSNFEELDVQETSTILYRRA